MTVNKLRAMLEHVNQDAIGFASDICDEGEFVVTGMLFNEATVTLTGEEHD